MRLKTFKFILIITTVIKCILAGALPLTGDEAYYIVWGMHPAGGYYDQPPLVGWIASLFLSVSSHPLWLRLPAVLTPALLSIGIVKVLKRIFPNRSHSHAYLAGAVFLLAPAQATYLFLTTDTPLILCSFFYLYFLCKNTQGNKQEVHLNALIAGVFLGLSFLSKYFALLPWVSTLGVALWMHSRKYRKMHSREYSQKQSLLVQWLIATAIALPFFAQHLLWNWDHCWINVVFNTVTRHESDSLNWITFRDFWIYQVLLATPWVLFFLARYLGSPKKTSLNTFPFQAHPWSGAYILALFAFAASALKHAQGIHWMLAFMAPLVIVAGSVLNEKELKTSAILSAGISTLIWILSFLFTALPESKIANSGHLQAVVLFRDTKDLLKEIERLTQKTDAGLYTDAPLFTDGYTTASLLSMAKKSIVSVYGEGTRFGRAFDEMTHFQNLDGMDLVIFSHHRRTAQEFQSQFESVEMREVKVHGATFTLIIGHRFKFATYRDEVLKYVREKYYPSLPYLPAPRCDVMNQYWNTSF